MTGQDRSSVSVLDWGRAAEAERIEVVVASTGADVMDAKLRAARRPPFILAMGTPEVAASIAAELRSRGVEVFVLRHRDLDMLPRAIAARSLAPAIGADDPMYLVDPWRGEGFGLRAKDVFCMVRARVNRSTIGRPEVEIEVNEGWGPDEYSFETISSRKRTVATSDIVDLWSMDWSTARRMPDGLEIPGVRHVRINGDKFNWRATLGQRRGFSDHHNADTLMVMLGEQAGNAALELGFADFRASTEVALKGSSWYMTASGTIVQDQHPAFGFYSAWCAVRHFRRLFDRRR